MEESKEDNTISELFAKEKQIREEESKKKINNTNHIINNNFTDTNYKNFKNKKNIQNLNNYYQQFPNQTYMNTNLPQMTTIASRNLDTSFNSKSCRLYTSPSPRDGLQYNMQYTM